jgi:hypothetical protein
MDLLGPVSPNLHMNRHFRSKPCSEFANILSLSCIGILQLQVLVVLVDLLVLFLLLESLESISGHSIQSDKRLQIFQVYRSD